MTLPERFINFDIETKGVVTQVTDRAVPDFAEGIAQR
jgi:hypothetical protein